jgi:hypothetical protein
MNVQYLSKTISSFYLCLNGFNSINAQVYPYYQRNPNVHLATYRFTTTTRVITPKSDPDSFFFGSYLTSKIDGLDLKN